MLSITHAEIATVTLENLSAVDTTIHSNQPSAAFGTKPYLNLSSTTDESRPLVQFATKGFPATITRATLNLYCRSATGMTSGASTQDLYTPTTAWANSVNWATKPTSTRVSTIPTVPVSGQWYSVDISTQLSAWLAGTPNNGIELRTSGSGTQESSFASQENADAMKRPSLVIEYDATPTQAWAEEFNGDSLDASIWTTSSGAASVSNGWATVSGALSTAGKKSFTPAQQPLIIEFRARRIDGLNFNFQIANVSNALDSINILESAFSGATGISGEFLGWRKI